MGLNPGYETGVGDCRDIPYISDRGYLYNVTKKIKPFKT